jgi:hypothetical protein
MPSHINFRAFGFALLLTSALPVFAGSPTKCDKIAQDVHESVSKEPTKVLMIVEDALVINETCACEIIEAAIVASHADVPLVKQIVQTAINVAPKMTPVIIECANAASPGAVSVEDGAKTASAKSPSGKAGRDSVQPGEDGVAGEDRKGNLGEAGGFGGSGFGGVGGGGGIRGVYLMAPSIGGIVGGSITPTGGKDNDKDRNGENRTPRRPNRPRPVSPSMAGWGF